MPDPTIHSVATKLDLLEERMNTKHATYETGLEAIRADMAHRETRLVITLILVVGMATTILGLVLSDNRPTHTYLIPHPTIETPTQPKPP